MGRRDVNDFFYKRNDREKGRQGEWEMGRQGDEERGGQGD